jgi:hypothetical protein
MKSVLTAALAALFVVPASAQAATVMISSTGFDAPGYRTGKIVHTPSATTLNNVGIGRLKLTGTELSTMTAVQYLTFCVDIFHTLGAGTFTMPSLASYVTNPVKLSQLTNLVSNATPLIASAATAAAKRDASAATQLAVWEILYENSGAFDLTAGQFKVQNGDSANARTLANTWLGNVSGGSWTPVAGKKLGFLFNQTNQSQIFLSNVPEPETWMLLISGFFMVGAASRRTARLRNMPVVLA